jgi:hypothetical protein
MKKQFLLALNLCAVLSAHGSFLDNQSTHNLAFEVLCDRRTRQTGSVAPRHQKAIDICSAQKIFVSSRNTDGTVRAIFSVRPRWALNGINYRLVFSDEGVIMYRHQSDGSWGLMKSYAWGHTE